MTSRDQRQQQQQHKANPINIIKTSQVNLIPQEQENSYQGHWGEESKALLGSQKKKKKNS